MSNPLPPVSGSTSTPTHLAPSDSRWGFRSVALLIGAGVGLVLIYTIYRRFMSEPISDQAHPLFPKKEPVLLSYKELNLPFKTLPPQVSNLSHKNQLCLNERANLLLLFPNYYAEGYIQIHLDDIFEKSISQFVQVTVSCSYPKQKFFEYIRPTGVLSSFGFFMPNMPFNEKMQLKIEVTYLGVTLTKDIDLQVNEARGFYEIKKDISSKSLPHQSTKRIHQLPSPLSIENPLKISLCKDQTVEITEEYYGPIVFDQQSDHLIVAYLQLVNRDSNPALEEAIALPFYLPADENATINPSDLTKLWRQAYFKATERKAPADLKLELTKIQVTTYLEDELSNSED